MPKSESNPSFLNDELSRRTSIFGLRLWVVLGICVGAGIVIVIFLLCLWFTSKRNQNRTHKNKTHNTHTITHEIPSTTTTKLSPLPVFSREITEIRFDNVEEAGPYKLEGSDQSLPVEASPGRIHIEIGKDHRITYPEKGNCSSSQGSGGGGGNRSGDQTGFGVNPEVSHLGWGHWYTLRELEESTNGFADENVIGEGGYGIVYRGVTENGTVIAVKNLMNNRGQAEKEFRVEVEAIGRVRHKNLVRLIGYCAEGAHRILVYEYVDNGNLEQWLHGEFGSHSPLTWESRMNIITGTAKGLTYLHEGLEPKVVHRDIKSSNILLDKQWNPKVSDFGLAKLLGSERNYVTTRVMGTFGYVAPEYASTGMLNERSDVYSFGILLMEIISGRNPVDYSRPPGEVNLVDWIKMLVSKRNTEGVLDPKLAEKPSSRALKRALLVALRCVDPNAQKRPKIGNVVHMLETEDFPPRDDQRVAHGHGRLRPETTKDRLMETMSVASVDSGSGYESGAPYPTHRLPWINQHEPEERSQLGPAS